MAFGLRPGVWPLHRAARPPRGVLGFAAVALQTRLYTHSYGGNAYAEAIAESGAVCVAEVLVLRNFSK